MTNEPFSDEKRSRKNAEFPTRKDIDDDWDFGFSVDEMYNKLKSAHDSIVADKNKEIAAVKNINATLNGIIKSRDREIAELKGRISLLEKGLRKVLDEYSTDDPIGNIMLDRLRKLEGGKKEGQA